MDAIIQKWGNSNAIRIPKSVLTTVGLHENDKVEIVICENGFSVQKHKGHISLAKRLEDFYKKPIDEIERTVSEELDWGTPVGEEIW